MEQKKKRTLLSSYAEHGLEFVDSDSGPGYVVAMAVVVLVVVVDAVDADVERADTCCNCCNCRRTES